MAGKMYIFLNSNNYIKMLLSPFMQFPKFKERRCTYYHSPGTFNDTGGQCLRDTHTFIFFYHVLVSTRFALQPLALPLPSCKKQSNRSLLPRLPCWVVALGNLQWAVTYGTMNTENIPLKTTHNRH